MFGYRWRLFSLRGFEVRLDASWLVLAFLAAWSLAEGLFPLYFPGLGVAVYWAMGVAGVIGLLYSIVLHEFSHSLVARRYGLPINGISLFLFGGVAEMENEPPSAKAEFLMAAAGPMASFAIGLAAFVVLELAVAWEWPMPLVGVIFYLVYLNLLLGIFNLLPAFPLDGGRMLRAALWGWRREVKGATRVASGVGRAFGIGLITLGGFTLLNGYAVSGLWWFLIGLFLHQAADTSYRQLLVKERVRGETVLSLMNPLPVAVSPLISLRELFDNYVYKYRHHLFPVVDGSRLVGCVDAERVGSVPKAEWARHTVEEFSGYCPTDNTIAPEVEASKALAHMTRTGHSRLLVVKEGRLLGTLTLNDLVQFISGRDSRP